MSACTICSHPKRQDIEYDRHHGVALSAISGAYDVHHLAVLTHMRLHVTTVLVTYPLPDTGTPAVQAPVSVGVVDEKPEDLLEPETPQSVLKLGIPHVRRAVQLAGDNRQEQERIVATLNEVLQDENMGLP